MIAYYDVDQQVVEDLIHDHGLDRDDWTHADDIAMLYKERFLPKEEVESTFLMYYWNKDCQMHEICEYYSVDFMRSDDRYRNPRYHKELERRIGKQFPDCLKSDYLWTMRDNVDALEVAHELGVFFPDDDGILFFAKWLQKTAQRCRTYEMSW